MTEPTTDPLEIAAANMPDEAPTDDTPADAALAAEAPAPTDEAGPAVDASADGQAPAESTDPTTDDSAPVDGQASAEPTTSTGRRAGLPAREGRPGRARRPAATPDEAHPVDPVALALAHRIVDLAADKKAADIVLLDIHVITTVADYLVICSGGSERQLGAIANGIIEALKDEDLLPFGREGGPSAHWALIDYGSVVVHVMATPEREYYQLEQLWADAPLLLHIQ